MNKRVTVLSTIMTLMFFASFGFAMANQEDKSMKDQSKTGSMLSSMDREFVKEAGHGGMMEVQMGKMALERATSEDVKQFAQRIIDDHTKANDELMQLASQKGITDSAHMEMKHEGMKPDDKSHTHEGGMDKKHQAEMSKMSSLSGAEFDREFMKGMVKDHAKAVGLFEKQSTKGKDADLKAFAAKTLPTLREHLQMARDISAKMKDGGKMKDSAKMNKDGR